jgi:hypothetical protein
MTSLASLCGLQLGSGIDVDELGAIQLQRLPGVAALELQRQHAHAHQVAAVDALEAARHHGLDAQQLRALGGPVARGAGAVFLAGEDDGGRPSAMYFMAAS